MNRKKIVNRTLCRKQQEKNFDLPKSGAYQKLAWQVMLGFIFVNLHFFSEKLFINIFSVLE